jgi:RNA polymerase sigma factor (sigma-70 family)
MSEQTWATLRLLLAEKYEDLRLLLARKLGSEELARETLHETWLRLNRTDPVGQMRSPKAYLFRVALNLAADRLRADKRRVRRTDVDIVIETLADEAPGPAREAEGRMRLAALEEAVQELPYRQRAILIAVQIEGVTHQKIAERLGVSAKTVQTELKAALKFCENYIDKM